MKQNVVPVGARVVPSQGVLSQGVPSQGVPSQGVPSQGVPSQGVGARLVGPRLVGSRLASGAILLGLVAGGPIACSAGSESSNERLADAAEAAQVESDVETVGQALLGDDGADLTSLDLRIALESEATLSTQGARAKLAVGARFSPSGCARVEGVSAAGLRVSLEGCAGPRGLATVSGSVVVSLESAGPNGLEVRFEGKDLRVGGATVDWTATAKLHAEQGQRTLVWIGALEGTTASGRTFKRTNTKKVVGTVADACITVDGESSGTVTGHELVTTFDGWKRCAHRCPESGTITVKDLTTGETRVLTFDGTAEVSVSGGDGGATKLPLRCHEG